MDVFPNGFGANICLITPQLAVLCIISAPVPLWSPYLYPAPVSCPHLIALLHHQQHHCSGFPTKLATAFRDCSSSSTNIKMGRRAVCATQREQCEGAVDGRGYVLKQITWTGKMKGEDLLNSRQWRMGQSEDSKKSKYGVELSEEIMTDKECLDEIANEHRV